ncbi:MAG: MBOAT family protein [Rhodospirillales bacterium]|nr:MBOAT family protein [Rhodospirillales bacterium]
MVFSSAIFLFVFLPLFIGLYTLTPARSKSLTILAGSYIFYGWWRIDFLGLLIAVTLGNHLFAKGIVRYEGTLRARRLMQAGVVANLLVLGVFKYFNFGVESLNAVFESSGLNTFEALRFILPIGISFYIFQSISFLIDVYRGDAPPAKRFIDFAAFISLFPQLIAGPVLRYKDLADQFEHREHSLDKFSEGATRFMAGFAKKVLIADTVAPLADAAFALDNPTMAESWLGAMAYTVQLYFDFSGYSDMAIGIGLMLGFRFIENFNFPYISRSITEFWRRWHISLSTWLRDYLYIPLGGNRKGKIRTYINLFLTMVLGGLWHGANWTFVVWGAWHGGIMAIERRLGIQGGTNESVTIPMRIFRTILTFFFVILGWVMFRADNISSAMAMYEGMFGFNGTGISERMDWQIKGIALSALGIGLFVIFIGPLLHYRAHVNLSEQQLAHKHVIAMQIGIMALFVLAVSRLLAQSYSPFLYFQF